MKGLKEKRLEAGLTLKQVSEQLGVSLKSVFNYERGDRRPNIEKLLKLSQMFNCSIEDLL
ncbi:MAG: helix-turn-helix transcriptional regulator [Clostridia bacterium]